MRDEFLPYEYVPSDPSEADITPLHPVELFESSEPQAITSLDENKGEIVKNRAQEISTEVYLREGFIKEIDLDEDGVYRDEYSGRSVYAVALNNKRESTMRYINADKKVGIMSLPTAKRFSIDPRTLAKTAKKRKISDLKPSEIIEISALAALPETDENLREQFAARGNATKLIQAQFLRESLDNDYKVWIMNTHEIYVRYLRSLVGNDQVHVLGETKEYMESPTVPVAINPQEAVKHILSDTTKGGQENKQYLTDALNGVSDRYLPKDLKKILEEEGVEIDKSTVREKILQRKGKILGQVGLYAWAAAKGVGFSYSPGFHGSGFVYWALDVVTVPPYVYGLAEVVSPRSSKAQVIGAAVAAISFIGPYGYIAAEGGGDFPWYIDAGLGALVGYATLGQVRAIRKDRKLQENLRTPSDDPDHVDKQ
jgi:hypothetical protein